MKSTTFGAGVGAAVDNSACPTGGSRLEFGYDDVDTSLGVAGVLDTAEVIGTLTQRACNGLNAGRNLLINGEMRIDQRNGGGAITAAQGFPVDRFRISFSTTGGLSAQRSSVVPPGFSNSLKLTVTSAEPSLAAGNHANISQRVEGYNSARLAFGSSSAQSVALSFWVRSSTTGAYAVALRNGPNDRSYVATYTIAQADVWEKKTITIPGDTLGIWATDNTVGLHLAWSLGSGSTYSTASSESWIAGNFILQLGGTNFLGTAGATFYLTGAQLEAGSASTSFEFRSIAEELQQCQRYYEYVGRWQQASPVAGTGGAEMTVALATTKRTTEYTVVIADDVGNPGKIALVNYGHNVTPGLLRLPSAFILSYGGGAVLHNGIHANDIRVADEL